MNNPTETQLAEFYDCALQTGYDTPKQALKIESKERGGNNKNIYIHKCDYCPGYHAYDTTHKLNDVDKAQEAWQQFITNVYV
jgi:hypothetical protein